MIKILFVCTGNICRSPTAEAVMRQRIKAQKLEKEIMVDSAGTQGYHAGEVPDMRSTNAARKRGIPMEGITARLIAPDDFQEFDLILGLDHGHVRALNAMAPKDAKAKVALFLDYAGATQEKEVPDPYYDSLTKFEYVLDLIESGVDAMIANLKVKSHVA